MTNADAKTNLSFDTASDAIKLTWAQEQDQAIVRKVKHIFDRVNKYNFTKYNKSLFGNNKAFTTQPAYHLLGGCALNQATNDVGELKNHKNLFVTDGALLPPYIGVNPALTITALAERNIERIVSTVFRKAS